LSRFGVRRLSAYSGSRRGGGAFVVRCEDIKYSGMLRPDMDCAAFRHLASLAGAAALSLWVREHQRHPNAPLVLDLPAAAVTIQERRRQCLRTAVIPGLRRIN